MNWVRRVTRDNVLILIIIIVFGILSLATVVAARSAQVASRQTKELIERSNINSPLIALIRDCTTPGGECASRNAEATQKAVLLITAQQACIVKESLDYKLPDRSPAEIAEIKNICHTLLNGDALDLLRRSLVDLQNSPANTPPTTAPGPSVSSTTR